MSRASRLGRSFARHLSSARRTAAEEGWLEDLRGLQRQDRLEMQNLRAEADKLLLGLEQFREPLIPVVESVSASLSQNKYICTQRLASAKDIVGNMGPAVKHLNAVKDHINDLEHEPYPQWSPGDSDAILRQIQDPQLDYRKLEIEADTRDSDTRAEIERLYYHITNAEAVVSTLRAKGLPAALAHANELTSKPEAERKPLPLPKLHEAAVIDIDDDLDDTPS